jgi:tetratricopeptide (TPR) repeat protein
MPAFNQLALYYFKGAKKRSAAADAKAASVAPKVVPARGARGARVAAHAGKSKFVDVQALELAALVCSQAIRKGPTYAPIFNTAGLIQSELGQINGAVGSFQRAATLDQRFFEAQMNLAAVNLSYRGFDRAQEAYGKALAVRPNDYEAHLGLALALRGQITDANFDKQVPAVQSELDQCKKLDANRPDALFNEGILTQEYKANSGGAKDAQITQLEAAAAMFANFVAKAGDKPLYADGVKKANERIEDIKQTIAFLKEAPPSAPTAPPPAAAPAPAASPAPGAAAAPPDPTGGAAAPAGPKEPAPTPAPGQPVAPKPI